MVRRRSAGEAEHQVLSTTTILVWAGVLLVVAAGSVTVLWLGLGTGGSRDAVRLDVIRTASSIVLGTGGAAALLLAARRQRATELDVKQKDHDATERRVTELYGYAADQLGNDKAPVRLAGLYALERLAQGNPAHRQTIANLICAYLRMPCTSSDPGREPGQDREEAEVRQVAQALLVTHLRPGDGEAPADTFWPGIELNLSGAVLVKFSMTHCVVAAARFDGATFHGPTTFRGATFEATADFRNTTFHGLADFRRVGFGAEGKPFRGARFTGEVDFGTHTTAQLTDATTRTDREPRRKWPDGWIERTLPGADGWAELVPAPRNES